MSLPLCNEKQGRLFSYFTEEKNCKIKSQRQNAPKQRSDSSKEDLDLLVVPDMENIF